MNRSLSITVALSALALLLAPTGIAKDTTQKVESPLTRPSGAPDGDAKGRIRVEHDASKNRDKLNIEVENIDTSLTFEAWMDNGAGTLTMIGTLGFNAPGEVEAEFDTDEGPGLPFGANAVADLAGRDVEIRSGGSVYLIGSVPSLSGGTGGTGGGGSGGSSGGDWVSIKSSLIRPVGGPDANATGYVEVRKRAKDNNQKFKVEAEHLDPAGSFAVFVEDAIGSGNLVGVGAMSPHKTIGEFELEIETEHGSALPLGASDVADLGGRSVEVRDGSNATVLMGTIPTLGSPKSLVKGASALLGTGSIGGNGKVKVRSWPKKSSERFELEIKKTGKNLSLDVFVFDSTSASFVFYTSVSTGKNGKVKVKAETKKGQALPLDAATVKALGGLTIEIRESGTGTVLFSGVIPAL